MADDATTYNWPANCDNDPSVCSIISWPARQYLRMPGYAEGFYVALSWDVMLSRWAVFASFLFSSLLAFLFGAREIYYIFRPRDPLADHPAIKGSAASKLRKNQQDKNTAEKIREENEEAERVTIEEALGQIDAKRKKEADVRKQKRDEEAKNQPAKPKRIDPVREKRINNLMKRRKEIGDVDELITRDEIEDALRETGNHAGKAMDIMEKIVKQREKNKYADEKEGTAAGSDAKDLIGKSRSRHGSHSYYHAHNTQSSVSEEQFQMNKPALLKVEKTEKKAETAKRLNIADYSWTEEESHVVIRIPLRQIPGAKEAPAVDLLAGKGNLKPTLEWKRDFVRLLVEVTANSLVTSYQFEVTKTYHDILDATLAVEKSQFVLSMKKMSGEQWYKLAHPSLGSQRWKDHEDE